MAEKPKVTSSAQAEMDKVEKQFEAFDENVKNLTMDRMNAAPKEEAEPQTKIASTDIQKKNDVYLKPKRVIACRDKFNERFRQKWEFDKEYVQFIAENKEIIGETIDMWTRPYGGINAEWWEIPTNKPVWAPRYVAEQLKGRFYHRLVMQQNTITAADGMGSYYGQLAADTTIQRLDAIPVSQRRSVFTGSKGF